jgi:hypothetical protein
MVRRKARRECTKSPTGKHRWTVTTKEDVLGNQFQYRRCDYCHLKQEHVKNFLTGRSEGWKSI